MEPPRAWSIPKPGASFLDARGRARRAPSGLSRHGVGGGLGRGRVRPGCGVARGRGGGGGAMAVVEAVEAAVPCRVQYLEDADPFAFGSFPEPRRAPVYAVEEALALGAQLPALHRLVGAPLPVSRNGVRRGEHRAGTGWGLPARGDRGARDRMVCPGKRSRCESRRDS